MGRVGTIIAGGLVTIGVITALTMNGRNTAGTAKAVGDSGSKLFSTVIQGK